MQKEKKRKRLKRLSKCQPNWFSFAFILFYFLYYVYFIFFFLGQFGSTEPSICTYIHTYIGWVWELQHMLAGRTCQTQIRARWHACRSCFNKTRIIAWHYFNHIPSVEYLADNKHAPSSTTTRSLSLSLPISLSSSFHCQAVELLKSQ